MQKVSDKNWSNSDSAKRVQVQLNGLSYLSPTHRSGFVNAVDCLLLYGRATYSKIGERIKLRFDEVGIGRDTMETFRDHSLCLSMPQEETLVAVSFRSRFGPDSIPVSHIVVEIRHSFFQRRQIGHDGLILLAGTQLQASHFLFGSKYGSDGSFATWVACTRSGERTVCSRNRCVGR